MNKYSEEYLKAIETAYLDLIQPRTLVEYFENDVEFKEWAELGSASDLRACLKAFERDELFHHCSIIKEVLIVKTTPIELNRNNQ
jgi:hypothetical protein|tara:strand:- start:692 stop:946 length:255 start_codon:yes stop_codon:yes gene_type:complete